MPYTYKPKLYSSTDPNPFTLSRSKLELFHDCPRCFYMDCHFGISRPNFPPFTLNSTVDTLLKNEFDLLRKNGQSHQLMDQYQLDALPFNHPDLPKWRGEVPGYQYIGASYVHQQTNFKLTGMVDDLWINSQDEIIVVDYKATSSAKEFNLDDTYKQSYKRQIEFYQYLFRQNSFLVSDTGYFVVANATKNRSTFDGRLEFSMSIVTYSGSDHWVEPQLKKVKKCLDSDSIPDAAAKCEYCRYRRSSVEVVTAILKKTKLKT